MKESCRIKSAKHASVIHKECPCAQREFRMNVEPMEKCSQIVVYYEHKFSRNTSLSMLNDPDSLYVIESATKCIYVLRV
jgi:hypothetical protein